jgi:hypothetical protein
MAARPAPIMAAVMAQEPHPLAALMSPPQVRVLSGPQPPSPRVPGSSSRVTCPEGCQPCVAAGGLAQALTLTCSPGTGTSQSSHSSDSGGSDVDLDSTDSKIFPRGESRVAPGVSFHSAPSLLFDRFLVGEQLSPSDHLSPSLNFPLLPSRWLS